MRPLRGRRVRGGGSAGRAMARCARPRATHGYFVDRSAVADVETDSLPLAAQGTGTGNGNGDSGPYSLK